MPEKSFQNAVQRSLIQVASAPQCSRKLWTKPNSGNSVPCILPCKIGGSWNLMKERYLSKTPFLRFVYLSKCKIDLPCIFRNSQKRFLWTGLVCTKFRYKLSAEHSTHINTKGLFLSPGSSRTMFSIILRHNSKRITRVSILPFVILTWQQHGRLGEVGGVGKKHKTADVIMHPSVPFFSWYLF